MEAFGIFDLFIEAGSTWHGFAEQLWRSRPAGAASLDPKVKTLFFAYKADASPSSRSMIVRETSNCSVSCLMSWDRCFRRPLVADVQDWSRNRVATIERR